MAYTSVIPVRRLDRAVKYVMNKEKTTAVSLQDALDYAANRDKTEQSCFESSYACTLETAFADMRQTREQWNKPGGVQGYHLVQSFAADEVTPELAHQIAKELADRVLGGRYEYVIGTHLNTDHIHSHIVWNSVSRIDGKKYHSNGKSYVTQIRAVSDELCRKYKLSVIDTENSNHVAKPYAEWLAEKNGQPTWRTAIRQDVDEAIQQSLTWRQFLNALERNGYEVRMGRKYPILRPPGKERFHTAGTLHIFLKRKRQHFDLHIAPGNKGGYFTGQHIGIGTCDVYIYIFLDIQTVDHFRKIRDVLHLIQKNVSHLFGNKTVFQVSVQFFIVGKFLKIHILKIDGNNLVLFDAILQQPILVHFHQNRLSAAADTCYDFDELLVLKRNQFIQVFSSGNSHNNPPRSF